MSYFVMLGNTTITSSLHGGAKRYQKYKCIFSNGLLLLRLREDC